MMKPEKSASSLGRERARVGVELAARLFKKAGWEVVSDPVARPGPART